MSLLPRSFDIGHVRQLPHWMSVSKFRGLIYCSALYRCTIIGHPTSLFSMSHVDSIANNKKSFAVTGELYDEKESVQTLADLFTISLLQFDVDAPRKTFKDSDLAITTPDVIQLKRELALPHELERKLIHPNTKVLDFACGTGVVLERIAPYIAEGQFIGVDISDTMLSRFDEKAAHIKRKLPKLDVRSLCGDILDPNFDTSSLEKLADVLICTLAFHHLHGYEEVAAKLKTFVAPGGWILIYDFYNEDNELPILAELAGAGVSRHGLSIDEMNQCLEGGCTKVSSAREFKAQIWQEKLFIMSHCRQAITDNLSSFPNKGDLYCVDCSVILGVAQVE